MMPRVGAHHPGQPRPYLGRFAPSPTGPLHLGSLVCALASYLDARANGGNWLLRIEDLDPPREVPGSTESILRSLDRHHLFWDGNTIFQSNRLEAYAEALNSLRDQGLTFFCTCTRHDVAEMGGLYNGHCRHQIAEPGAPHSVRFRTPGRTVRFNDGIQGEVETSADTIDDFIVLRKDGLFAYQLAVVVDDAWQGVTRVLRGSDLLDSTPRQILLDRALGFDEPDWLHIPVLSHAGSKLSKQTGARGVDDREASANLITALGLLNQNTAPLEPGMSPQEILEYAVDHWRLQNIQRSLELELPRPD